MAGFTPARRFTEIIALTNDAKDGQRQAAEKVKQIAEEIAPYSEEGDRYLDTEGHYKDAFAVVEDDDGNVYVANSNFKAHWIEWGYHERDGAWHPGQGVIKRAVWAAGYTLREEGKQ